MLDLACSYLNSRSQCAYYTGSFSSPRVLLRGTHQSSIWCPFLFSIFAHDVQNSRNVMEFSFYSGYFTGGMSHKDIVVIVRVINKQLQNIFRLIIYIRLTYILSQIICLSMLRMFHKHIQLNLVTLRRH